MYFYMGMMFDSKENIPDFGSIKMYFVGTKQLGYIEQNNKKFRKYVLLSSDLSKLNLITNAINGSIAFLTDTGETYKLSDNGWQKWSDAASSASLSLKPVEELPQTGQPGYIYLVPNEHSENDNYDEYIWTSDQTFEKIGNTAITYPIMTGATNNRAGTAGLVPAPSNNFGDQYNFLCGDGTWRSADIILLNTEEAEKRNCISNNKIDLNLINKSGTYLINTYSGSPSCINIPTAISNKSFFYLQNKVFSGYRHSYTIQKITSSDNKIYERQHKYIYETTNEWTEWEEKNINYSTATQNTDGLMSSTDKTKLDNIATPANLLTKSDIVICTQQEYDTMQSHQGLLYFIKEVNS